MSRIVPDPSDTPIKQGEHWFLLASLVCTQISLIEGLEQDQRHELLERVAGVALESSKNLRRRSA